MRVALFQVCVDPRLNHELIRVQIGQQLARRGLHADRIVLVNEIGGNLSGSFGNALDLFRKEGGKIVLCGVLHHDDCAAAKHGLRQPLEETARQIEGLLRERKVACPVETGTIYTETNHVQWSGQSERGRLSWTR